MTGAEKRSITLMNQNECQYCGTILLNLVDIDIENKRPVYIKIRHNGQIFCAKTLVDSLDVTLQPQYNDFTMDNGHYLKILSSNNIEVECRFIGIY